MLNQGGLQAIGGTWTLVVNWTLILLVVSPQPHRLHLQDSVFASFKVLRAPELWGNSTRLDLVKVSPRQRACYPEKATRPRKSRAAALTLQGPVLVSAELDDTSRDGVPRRRKDSHAVSLLWTGTHPISCKDSSLGYLWWMEICSPRPHPRSEIWVQRHVLQPCADVPGSRAPAGL
ncbi:uncharacterized protein LOC107500233 [Rousettus aegyptiacus]|uniref:uncharacterized protein LOC107500233 n=1 Tax=Rousettus aegyptiacus TaxID=9407 RepID=UPI00168CB51D|nr:uncharacterized protein LOC107500233 [Rousettus aegyptiacus]